MEHSPAERVFSDNPAPLDFEVFAAAYEALAFVRPGSLDLRCHVLLVATRADNRITDGGVGRDLLHYYLCPAI